MRTMGRLLAGIGEGVRRLSDVMGRLTEGFLLCITGGVVLLIGAQVLCRYVLNHSIFWAEEVGRILLVWITFLGGSVAFKRRAHMGVEFFVQRLSASGRKFCRCCVLISASAFFMVLLVYGWLYCLFVSTQKTPALGLPMAVPFAVLPLSGLLFLVHAADQLMSEWWGGKT